MGVNQLFSTLQEHTSKKTPSDTVHMLRRELVGNRPKRVEQTSSYVDIYSFLSCSSYRNECWKTNWERVGEDRKCTTNSERHHAASSIEKAFVPSKNNRVVHMLQGSENGREVFHFFRV